MNDNHELYNREVISALDRLAIDNSRVASFKYFEDIVFEFVLITSSSLYTTGSFLFIFSSLIIFLKIFAIGS